MTSVILEHLTNQLDKLAPLLPLQQEQVSKTDGAAQDERKLKLSSACTTSVAMISATAATESLRDQLIRFLLVDRIIVPEKTRRTAEEKKRRQQKGRLGGGTSSSSNRGPSLKVPSIVILSYLEPAVAPTSFTQLQEGIKDWLCSNREDVSAQILEYCSSEMMELLLRFEGRGTELGKWIVKGAGVTPRLMIQQDLSRSSLLQRPSSSVPSATDGDTTSRAKESEKEIDSSSSTPSKRNSLLALIRVGLARANHQTSSSNSFLRFEEDIQDFIQLLKNQFRKVQEGKGGGSGGGSGTWSVGQWSTAAQMLYFFLSSGESEGNDDFTELVSLACVIAPKMLNQAGVELLYSIDPRGGVSGFSSQGSVATERPASALGRSAGTFGTDGGDDELATLELWASLYQSSLMICVLISRIKTKRSTSSGKRKGSIRTPRSSSSVRETTSWFEQTLIKDLVWILTHAIHNRRSGGASNLPFATSEDQKKQQKQGRSDFFFSTCGAEEQTYKTLAVVLSLFESIVRETVTRDASEEETPSTSSQQQGSSHMTLSLDTVVVLTSWIDTTRNVCDGLAKYLTDFFPSSPETIVAKPNTPLVLAQRQFFAMLLHTSRGLLESSPLAALSDQTKKNDTTLPKLLFNPKVSSSSSGRGGTAVDISLQPTVVDIPTLIGMFVQGFRSLFDTFPVALTVLAHYQQPTDPSQSSATKKEKPMETGMKNWPLWIPPLIDDLVWHYVAVGLQRGFHHHNSSSFSPLSHQGLLRSGNEGGMEEFDDESAAILQSYIDMGGAKDSVDDSKNDTLQKFRREGQYILETSLDPMTVLVPEDEEEEGREGSDDDNEEGSSSSLSLIDDGLSKIAILLANQWEAATETLLLPPSSSTVSLPSSTQGDEEEEAILTQLLPLVLFKIPMTLGKLCYVGDFCSRTTINQLTHQICACGAKIWNLLLLVQQEGNDSSSSPPRTTSKGSSSRTSSTRLEGIRDWVRHIQSNNTNTCEDTKQILSFLFTAFFREQRLSIGQHFHWAPLSALPWWPRGATSTTTTTSSSSSLTSPSRGSTARGGSVSSHEPLPLELVLVITKELLGVQQPLLSQELMASFVGEGALVAAFGVDVKKRELIMDKNKGVGGTSSRGQQHPFFNSQLAASAVRTLARISRKSESMNSFCGLQPSWWREYGVNIIMTLLEGQHHLDARKAILQDVVPNLPTKDLDIAVLRRVLSASSRYMSVRGSEKSAISGVTDLIRKILFNGEKIGKKKTTYSSSFGSREQHDPFVLKSLSEVVTSTTLPHIKTALSEYNHYHDTAADASLVDSICPFLRHITEFFRVLAQLTLVLDREAYPQTIKQRSAVPAAGGLAAKLLAQDANDDAPPARGNSNPRQSASPSNPLSPSLLVKLAVSLATSSETLRRELDEFWISCMREAARDAGDSRREEVEAAEILSVHRLVISSTRAGAVAQAEEVDEPSTAVSAFPSSAIAVLRGVTSCFRGVKQQEQYSSSTSEEDHVLEYWELAIKKFLFVCKRTSPPSGLESRVVKEAPQLPLLASTEFLSSSSLESSSSPLLLRASADNLFDLMRKGKLTPFASWHLSFRDAVTTYLSMSISTTSSPSGEGTMVSAIWISAPEVQLSSSSQHVTDHRDDIDALLSDEGISGQKDFADSMKCGVPDLGELGHQLCQLEPDLLLKVVEKTCGSQASGNGGDNSSLKVLHPLVASTLVKRDLTGRIWTQYLRPSVETLSSSSSLSPSSSSSIDDAAKASLIINHRLQQKKIYASWREWQLSFLMIGSPLPATRREVAGVNPAKISRAAHLQDESPYRVNSTSSFNFLKVFPSHLLRSLPGER